MPKIVFIQPDGLRREIEAPAGITLMEAARLNNVLGVVAQCGGACACATCHVYVDEAFMPKVGKPTGMEEDMLDFAYDVKPNSRLSCQIKLTPALDGLKITTPDRQG